MLKTFLLIGASALSLAATSAQALTTFTYTGGFQTFTATTGGTYVIDAFGAQGGRSAVAIFDGGMGAGVEGIFNLAAGQVIDIAVGGLGIALEGNSAGGGGGSFVTSAGIALLVAGGGGGTNYYQGQDGQPADGSTTGAGGSGGVGGLYAVGGGGGGGGFNGNGESGTAGRFTAGGAGGNGYPSLAGSGSGGFGGGGDGGVGYFAGSGGGGGFNGGFGGNPNGGGGGGSSYNAGTAQTVLGTRAGNGLVTIDLLESAVPEPSSWAMMMLGFAAIGAAMRRRLLRLA